MLNYTGLILNLVRVIFYATTIVLWFISFIQIIKKIYKKIRKKPYGKKNINAKITLKIVMGLIFIILAFVVEQINQDITMKRMMEIT